MCLEGKIIKRLLLILLIISPFAAWAIVKPVRVVAPELNGVSCPLESICIDEKGRIEEAKNLYEESMKFVEGELGKFESHPTVVFCSTVSCFKSFGFEKSSANAIGTFGIVVGPKAWKNHYIRHEMIHYLQSERLGVLKGWLVTPDWFNEGMAYGLSGDPRETLSDPWQGYRAKFMAWYESVGKANVWQEAGKL